MKYTLVLDKQHGKNRKPPDKRAVKAAQEHAIPEMVLENYKIKEQQTKIMQRMLIEIHKEIRKQHLRQKVQKLQREETEQYEDCNPWVDDDEKKHQNKEQKGTL